MSGFAVAKYYGLYQGLPAASGTLNIYQTGTTTPVTCYSDGGLTTPITNPITLDSNGCAAFFYSGSVNLKFVSFTATGTLIETLDPIYPTGSSVIGTTIKVSSNISITASNAGNNLVATTAVNYTLPLTTTLSTSFNFNANAQGGAITLIPQSSDAIQQQSSGVNYVLAQGGSGELWTDANGNWGINFLGAGIATSSTVGTIKPDGTILTITSSGAATVAKATSSGFGVMEPDNVSIQATAGVVSTKMIAALGVNQYILARTTSANVTIGANTAVVGTTITAISLGATSPTGAVSYVASGDSLPSSNTYAPLTTINGSSGVYGATIFQRVT